MKNKKVDKLNLSDEDKKHVKNLRNRRRRARRQNRKWDRAEQGMYLELIANGR